MMEKLNLNQTDYNYINFFLNVVLIIWQHFIKIMTTNGVFIFKLLAIIFFLKHSVCLDSLKCTVSDDVPNRLFNILQRNEKRDYIPNFGDSDD